MYKQRTHLFNEFLVCGLDEQNVRLEENNDTKGYDCTSTRCQSSVLLQIPFSTADEDDSIRKLCLPDDVIISTNQNADNSNLYALLNRARYHAFVMVRENGEKQYGGSLVFPQDISERKTLETLKLEDKKVSALKSICLTTSYPLGETIKNILTIIHESNFGKNSSTIIDKTLIEKYVFLLLYELAVPHLGSATTFALYQQLIYIHSPEMTEFSLFDFDIRSTLNSIKTSTFLQLMSHVLSECRVLIVSSDYNKIVQLTETLIVLMYPFNWPHTYVPIVPLSMLAVLQAPFPFIMGVKKSNFDNIDDCMTGYCIFDVETNELTCSKTIPSLPFSQAFSQELDSTLELFEPNKTDSSPVEKRVFVKANSLGEIHQKLFNHEGYNYLKIQFYNKLAREIFLNYFIQILNNFVDYIIEPVNMSSMHDWINERTELENFERTKFLAKQSKYTHTFMSIFTTSQVFVSFIDSIIGSRWKSQNDSLLIFNKHREAFFTLMTDEQKSEGMIYHQTCSQIPDIDDSFSTMVETMVVNRVKHEATNSFLPSEQRNAIKDYDDLKWSPLFSIKRKAGVFKYNASSKRGRSFVANRKVSTPNIGRRRSIDGRFMNPNAICKQLLLECNLKSKLFFVESTNAYSHPLIGSIRNNAEEDNVDEAVIVSSLCDLLGRIWSHRKQANKASNPFWHHLQCYATLNNSIHGRTNTVNLKLGHSLSWCIMRKKLNPFRAYEETKIQTADITLTLSQIIKYMVLGCVEHATQSSLSLSTIQQIKSPDWNEKDLVEAFVRLCLEYRVLKECLSIFLSESDLLRALYKQDAFLRREHEREMFLLNMEATNFANFSSFTNYYCDLIVKYRIQIQSSKERLGLKEAKPFIIITGSVNKSHPISFPNDATMFSMKRTNLGEVQLIYVDHDRKGRNNRLSLDYITIHNDVTKRSYRFHCKHSYKHSSEVENSGRYIAAEAVGEDEERNPRIKVEYINRNNVGLFGKEISLEDVQNNIWYAMEEAFAHLSSIEVRPGAFLYLVLQEGGIAHRVENVVSDRLKPYLTRKRRIWEVYCEYAEGVSSNSKTKSKKSLDEVIVRMNERFKACDSHTKFQLWFCIAWCTRNLSRWFVILFHYFQNTRIFELDSFSCDRNCAAFFCNMMARLEEQPYAPRFPDIDEFCISLGMEL